MPQFAVTVTAIFCGAAGSRWFEAVDQVEEWGRANGLSQLAVGEPGCSVDHSMVPITFPLAIECPSKEEVPERVRTWARQQPLMLRAITQGESGR